MVSRARRVELHPDELRSRFASKHDAARFAEEHGLLSHRDVALAWQARSGERISAARVQQILRRAEAKLRRLLREDAEP